MLSRKQWIILLALVLIALVVYDQTTRKVSNLFPQSARQPGNASTNIVDQTSWKLFTSDNQSFQLLFPSQPQHVSEKHPKGAAYTKYDVYLAQERDGSVFMLSSTQYPPNSDPDLTATQGDDLLDSVMKSALKANATNTLIHSERSSFQNEPSIDFAIQNRDYFIRSRAILVDKTLYVLTVMERTGGHLEHDFDTFAGSFSLKSGNQPQRVS